MLKCIIQKNKCECNNGFKHVKIDACPFRDIEKRDIKKSTFLMQKFSMGSTIYAKNNSFNIENFINGTKNAINKTSNKSKSSNSCYTNNIVKLDW